MWSYSYSDSRLHPSLRDETNRRPTAASPQEPATPPRTRWHVSRSRNSRWSLDPSRLPDWPQRDRCPGRPILSPTDEVTRSGARR